MIGSMAVAETRTAIGLDIGGTKVAVAVVDACGSVLDRSIHDTPVTDPGPVILSLILDAVADLRSRWPDVSAVGVGAAGIVEWPSGVVRWAPNNSYRGLALRDRLAEATGLPVAVDNDANVAAWAEATIGAAAGSGNVLALTVGTGVGGGLVLDGRLHRGPRGIGMEVGHLVVDPGGAQCGCGNEGCLEAVASGTALGRMARAVATADPTSALAASATRLEDITSRTALAAAQAGDTTAIELFARAARWLGAATASLVNLVDVDIVVVGGGLSGAGGLLMEPLRQHYEQHVFAREHRRVPALVRARFGNDAGVVGAAMLVLRPEPGAFPEPVDGGTAGAPRGS